MTVRLAVVGTPGDRRVSLFRDAALAYGLAEPHVISWRDVLAGREVSAPAGALLRVESPGEDAGTDALLRGPGDPSRVGGGAAWYRAFLAGLGTVAAIPGVTLLADVDEIGVMFDKRRCHAVLERAGVPVPPAFEARSYEELRDSMAGRGWTRVFVKAGPRLVGVRGDRVRGGGRPGPGDHLGRPDGDGVPQLAAGARLPGRGRRAVPGRPPRARRAARRAVVPEGVDRRRAVRPAGGDGRRSADARRGAGGERAHDEPPSGRLGAATWKPSGPGRGSGSRCSTRPRGPPPASPAAS
ncbi:hypothetical protein ACFSTC_00205 [Nonomuraea ferruginea]